MKVRVFFFFLFFCLGIGGYAQEKSGGSNKGGGKSSGLGKDRREIHQKRHFKKPEKIITKGNGTSFRREKRKLYLKKEKQGFAKQKINFKKPPENSGFSSNSYRNKTNRKKGIR